MTPLDPGKLLTVDVGAEVSKLASAQIESAWQLPAELVRLALRGGARSVELTLRPSRLRMQEDGAGLSPSLLASLADLLDEALPPARRHRALLALESEAALGLIALAGLRYTRLRVQTPAGVLVHEPGSSPRSEKPRGDGSELQIDGSRFELERARSWLAAACRFAPARVRLDGTDLPRGFPDALVWGAIPSPLAGRIAIPRAGEVARIWVLRDGIVAAHLTLPDLPCFEAAVALPAGRGPSTAAALREAVAPCLGDLALLARALMLRLGRGLEALAEGDQRRVRHLLLKAVPAPDSRSELFTLPLFPALVPPTRSVRAFSLAELEAAGGSGRLPALYPDQDPGCHVLPEGPVFVLDTQERSALGRLLGLAFFPCVPRPASRSFRARLARLVAAGLAGAGRALRRCLHPWEGPPLPEGSLSPSERAFLAGLRDQFRDSERGGARLRLGAGRGPLRRRRGPSWLLPRQNGLVRASLRLAAGDPRWLYPAALALFEGRMGLKPEASLAWRNRPISGPDR